MARFLVYVLLLALLVTIVVTYQSRTALPPPQPTITPVPTRLPTPTPAPLPTVDVRPLIRDYAARARVPLVAMVQALEEVGRLLQSPALGDVQWRAAVTVQFDAIRQAHADMNAIVPPSTVDPYHRQITDGMRRCAQATDYLAAGLDRLSLTDMQAAQTLIARCADEINKGREGFETYTAEVGIHAPLRE